jgi:hypothetical protein
MKLTTCSHPSGPSANPLGMWSQPSVSMKSFST